MYFLLRKSKLFSTDRNADEKNLSQLQPTGSAQVSSPRYKVGCALFVNILQVAEALKTCPKQSITKLKVSHFKLHLVDIASESVPGHKH